MSTATEVAADLTGLALMTREKVHGVVVTYGAILQTAVKNRARGARTLPRPGQEGEGPRLLTGAYNRSINRRSFHTTTASTTMVGSNADQARRLELGFTGTDSLGRTFDQQPYPHFGPALDEVAPKFEAAIAAVAAPPKDHRP